jgi:hypothetical protein
MLTHILISIDALAERNLAFAYRQNEYTSMARNKSIWHSSHSRNSHASGEAWRSPLHRNGHEDLQRTATVLQRCQHAEISDSPSPVRFFARTARPIRPGCAGCRQVTTGICEWAVARGDGGGWSWRATVREVGGTRARGGDDPMAGVHPTMHQMGENRQIFIWPENPRHIRLLLQR